MSSANPGTPGRPNYVIPRQGNVITRVVRRHGGQVIAYIVLSAMSLISIFPFIWSISTSLKTANQIFAWPPKLIPDPIEWSNYPGVFDTLPFDRLHQCLPPGQLYHDAPFCSCAHRCAIPFPLASVPQPPAPLI